MVIGEKELRYEERIRLSAENMLRISENVDIFQFLTHSGSGNVAYIRILGSPNINKQMNLTCRARVQFYVDKKGGKDEETTSHSIRAFIFAYN